MHIVVWWRGNVNEWLKAQITTLYTAKVIQTTTCSLEQKAGNIKKRSQAGCCSLYFVEKLLKHECLDISMNGS